jgi:hypothetical protein
MVMIGVPPEDIFNDSILTAESTSRVQYVNVALTIIAYAKVLPSLNVLYVIMTDTSYHSTQHGHNVT